jgi:hypothetical protein
LTAGETARRGGFQAHIVELAEINVWLVFVELASALEIAAMNFPLRGIGL